MRNYDPFRELDSLRRDIDRAFANVGSSDRQMPVAFLPGRAARAYPLLNMSEDRDNVYVQALAPGLDPQHIGVTLHKNNLTISGEKAAPQGVKPEAFHRGERAAGKFTRTIELPADVDSNRIEARYQEGLLAIVLPKNEEAKPRQIPVELK